MFKRFLRNLKVVALFSLVDKMYQRGELNVPAIVVDSRNYYEVTLYLGPETEKLLKDLMPYNPTRIDYGIFKVKL